MNQEKLTDRCQGFIQNAQSLAARNSNQFLMPEHLLKVMLEDKEGMASSLLAQTGADVSHIRQLVDEDIEKLPTVQGSSIQVSASQNFLKILDLAEQMAKQKILMSPLSVYYKRFWHKNLMA